MYIKFTISLVILLATIIVLLANSVIANCPTTTPVAPGPPKCADYPDGYFINDFSDCQAYYFCPHPTSPPYPGKCSAPYNFDQTHQMCNHPDNYTCQSDECVAVAGGPYGENLYKIWGGSVDSSAIMATAIDSFYSEIAHYDFNNHGFSMQTGHFTQVVWSSSVEIGVGIATYPDPTYQHRTVVCINYKPPGNVEGQFRQNVLPPNVSLGPVLKRFNSTALLEKDKPKKTMIL
ncbi:hypothetical protein HA402_002899 [Bradysia odoriphaga]|nr:hypothetical protein HA402_002899 [Bradysia odoriphaga]